MVNIQMKEFFFFIKKKSIVCQYFLGGRVLDPQNL